MNRNILSTFTLSSFEKPVFKAIVLLALWTGRRACCDASPGLAQAKGFSGRRTWLFEMRNIRGNFDGDAPKTFTFLFDANHTSATKPSFIVKGAVGLSPGFSEIVANYISKTLGMDIVHHQAQGILLQKRTSEKVKNGQVVSNRQAKQCFGETIPCKSYGLMRMLGGLQAIGYRKKGENGKVHQSLNTTMAKLLHPFKNCDSFLRMFSRAYGQVLLLDSLLIVADRAKNNCFVDDAGLLFALDNAGFTCGRECRAPLQHIQKSGYRRCVREVWGSEFEKEAFTHALQEISCRVQRASDTFHMFGLLLRGDEVLKSYELKRVAKVKDEDCFQVVVKRSAGFFTKTMAEFNFTRYVYHPKDNYCSVQIVSLLEDFVLSRIKMLGSSLSNTYKLAWDKSSC